MTPRRFRSESERRLRGNSTAVWEFAPTGEVAMSTISFLLIPLTKLKGGHFGLKRKKGSTSDVVLLGSGLADGLDVTVLKPPNSASPEHIWTGVTEITDPDGTECIVELTAVRNQLKKARDDITTVSVTVGNSTPQITNVFTNDS
jgi:hypothetical protein